MIFLYILDQGDIETAKTTTKTTLFCFLPLPFKPIQHWVFPLPLDGNSAYLISLAPLNDKFKHSVWLGDKDAQTYKLVCENLNSYWGSFRPH